MKKITTFKTLITLGLVLAMSGCSPDMNDSLSIGSQQTLQIKPNPLVAPTQSETTNPTQENSDQKITYINKGTNDEAVLSTDPLLFKNNYYKYKNILVTFEAKAGAEEAKPKQEYDVFISQNGKKEILIPDLALNIYGEIEPLKTTKIPYIIDNSTGFGDAGIYWENQIFVNLLTQKKLSVSGTNVDGSLQDDAADNEVFKIGKNIFTLANKTSINKCLNNSDYKNNGLPLNYLLRDNVAVLKLPKTTYLNCSDKSYIVIDDYMELIGLDKDMKTAYVRLTYNTNNISSPPDAERQETNIVFAVNTANGAVKIVSDHAWEKTNIIESAE